MLTHVNYHQQHWPSAMCLNRSYRVLLVSVVLPTIIVGWLLLIFYFAILVTTLLCCHHPTALWCCKQNYCCCLPLLLLSLPPVDCLLQFLVSYSVLWLLLLDKILCWQILPFCQRCCHCRAVPASTAPCAAVLWMPLLLLLAVNIYMVRSPVNCCFFLWICYGSCCAPCQCFHHLFLLLFLLLHHCTTGLGNATAVAVCCSCWICCCQLIVTFCFLYFTAWVVAVLCSCSHCIASPPCLLAFP